MGKRAGRSPREPVTLTIESLSHEGRGVGRIDGKTVFVHGALPGERVRARVVRRRARFDEADTLEVLEASPARVQPRCAHFGVCGGCSLQHLGEADQLGHKQAVLLELLEHQAGIVPPRVAAPLAGPQWGYRRKARLGVKHVPKKGGVIVGFRERGKPYVTDCLHCDVLDPRVGDALVELRALIDGLDAAARIPQLEVALGDSRAVLIVRHLDPLSAADRAALAGFADRSGIDFYLQPGGPDTIAPLAGPDVPLDYGVAGLELAFAPQDFTQVNAAVNQQLIARALDWLEPRPHEQVIDLYCGIGNFSLPLAARAGAVFGIEGDAALVRRAELNAAANALDNCRFAVADLADAVALAGLDLRGASKVLMDPPRSGAAELLEALDLGAVERLVYVSCNPATFARDARTLTARHGFRLLETGIADMFPHTAHVESVSLFARG